MKVESCKDDLLTNLRCADDVLLVAGSLRTLWRMMSELKEQAHKVGLQMHMGKTNILTNVHGRPQSKASHVQIGGE